MACSYLVVALVSHHPVLFFVIFGLLALQLLLIVVRRLLGVIAAFRLVFAGDGKQAKRMSKALGVLEPRWHWKGQKRG